MLNGTMGPPAEFNWLGRRPTMAESRNADGVQGEGDYESARRETGQGHH